MLAKNGILMNFRQFKRKVIIVVNMKRTKHLEVLSIQTKNTVEKQTPIWILLSTRLNLILIRNTEPKQAK